MNILSIKYYIALILLVALLVLTRKINKKYLLILVFNYGFLLLFNADICVYLCLLSITVYTYLISKYISKNKVNVLLIILPIIATLVIFKALNKYSNIIIPIGLSFYSLQAIGYLVDVSKDNGKYENDFILFASSLSFFPAISSGPIEKLTNLMPRLKKELGYNPAKIKEGIQLIFEGLFKKLVIANRVIDYIDKVYTNPSSYSGLTILIAIVLYSIQLYCDFSAYSDISIGTAKMLGIDLMNNFDNPYFSKSIKEFWHKWHISLSSWLKEYVYIPLGGNKKSKTRKVFNTIITFLVSGIWHGLNVTYIIWGLIHGILNVIPTHKTNSPLLNFVKTVLTFTLVTVTWVFFRADSLASAFSIFNGLFLKMSIDMSSITSSILLFTDDITSITYAFTTFMMIFILFIKELICVYKTELYNENIYLFIIVVCLILFSTNGSGAFIYQGF